MDKIIFIPFDHSKYLTAADQAITLGYQVKKDGLVWKKDFYWYIQQEPIWDQKIYFTFRQSNSASYYRLKWLNEIHQ